jgi:hypothetical protein
MKNLTIFFIMLSSVTFAQSNAQEKLWQPFLFFVGEWTGKGEGEPGIGNYERAYQSVLGNKFIEVKNKSVYPPTDKNTKGEVHEDRGYISYDRSKKKFILRQFHVEGFVNTYESESISADGKKIVFITTMIENIPNGWRARESYEIISENEFIETFELAEPNKDFFVYSKATFKRK